MANGNSATRVVTANSTGVSCNHPSIKEKERGIERKKN